MAMNNVAIIIFDIIISCKNKQGVGNRIYVPNTDPLSYYRPLK